MTILPLVLAFGPSARAAYSDTRLSVLSAYKADVEAELSVARDSLEDLEEASLSPGRFDERAELALIRLALAETYLDHADASMRAVLEADTSTPAGWTPWEARLSSAEALIAKNAPELRPILDSAPVELAPLPGATLAQVPTGKDAIRIRGYYAVNDLAPEPLAALILHEAVHLKQRQDQQAKRRSGRYDWRDEREARAADAKFWLALGSPEGLDVFGQLKDDVAAYRAGGETLDRYAKARYAEEPLWAWVEPAVAPAAKPEAAGLSELRERAKAEGASDALARRAKEIVDLETQVRKNHAAAAASRLKAARERLEAFVELAAPGPKIVTSSVMASQALSARRFPETDWRFFQALHPVLAELDRAREVLSEKRLSQDERTELSAYLATREEPLKTPLKPEAAFAALSRLEGAAALGGALAKTTVVLERTPDPAFEKAHPDWVFVPGEREYREADPRSAFAWAVRVLAARQGRSELDAAELSMKALDAWSPEDKDPQWPLRWVAARAAWEEGGRPLLRLYLESRKDAWK